MSRPSLPEATGVRADTPHERETGQIVKALAEMGLPDRRELALGMQGLGGPGSNAGPALLLAVALSQAELDGLRIAVTYSPRPRRRWRRLIAFGHHQRNECLERPGEWCAAPHPGRCDSCPTHYREVQSAARMLGDALDLRRELDAVMWGSAR